MSNLSDIGNLMHLYLDEIDPGEGTKASEFLITATAQMLNRLGTRNWVPVIVKEVGEDRYEIIGNAFIYAVAEEAGLEKIWCIIADSNQETAEIAKVLSGEVSPKINLSTATIEEIEAALQYLIQQPGSCLKGIKLSLASTRIAESPVRKYWKKLDEVSTLRCGITKGKKVEQLKNVFFLTPQPIPEVIKDPNILKTLTKKQLDGMAKKRGMSGFSKKKKAELVALLSQD